MLQSLVRSILLLTSFFIFEKPVTAQHLSWQNFTTDQGLPGNTVYDVIEDGKGFLWFVTNQGICRFNGYDFIRPVDTSAMVGTEAFVPAIDQEGRIWFARLDASIWIIENDTVRSWKYNSIVASYKDKFLQIEQLRVAEDGTVWLGLIGLGLLKVNQDGGQQLISGSKNCFLFAEVAGESIYTIIRTYDDSAPFKPLLMEVLKWQNGNIIRLNLPHLPLNSMERGIWELSDSNSIYNWNGIFYYIKNHQVLWEVPANVSAKKICKTPTGEILVASFNGRNNGLLYYESLEYFKRNKYKNLLPGKHVTDVLYDMEGGWWVTTLNNGIFYCKNPKVDIFDATSGLPSNDITCLTNDGRETIFTGFRPAEISTINRLDGMIKNLPKPPNVGSEIWTTFFDTPRRKLWISYPLLYFEKDQWHLMPWIDTIYQRDPQIPAKYQSNQQIPAKKITLDPSGNILWISTPYGFFKYDINKNLAERILEKSQVSSRTFSVNSDAKGNIWVTTMNGLRLWRNGRYELPPFDHPALRFNARDLEMLPNGGFAIALLGYGLLIQDANGSFTQFKQADGLSSDFITKIYITREGVIYACSNTGLNRISHSEDGKWKVDLITTKEGLPSNQVNDVTVLADEIWVATNKGIAHLRNLPTSYPMPAPQLEKFIVNNSEIDFKQNMQIAPFQNNLSVQFFSLHFRSGGQINYRYRFLGADTTFKNTDTRLVNFANLSPGTYTFEVEAQNEGKKWSLPSQWTFKIRSYWYQTIWFWVLMTVSIVGIIVFWYRDRLLKAHKEVEVRNKIRNLEAEALRAQMNPHFIFNCLGSIQHFITENDADSATRYLARFARLVRLALHSSIDGKHSLQEEIEMLDHYLGLERLRFGEKFSYEIEVDPNLDKEDIFFPPLLIQPFVENALVHGMKSTIKSGKINISFKQHENELNVTVTDNGPGFSALERSRNSSGHKSVGMTLTKKRLKILSSSETFSVTPVVGTNGVFEGTRVCIVIPIS